MNKQQEKKSLYSPETLGKNLKKLRKSRGYTQDKLLSELSKYGDLTLSPRAYRDYENNTGSSDISSQRLYAFSDILGVSMNELVGKISDSKITEESIFNLTGLSTKSVTILNKKRRNTFINSKRIKKSPLISINVADLDEADVLNYIIQNSNILTSFLNSAKSTYINMLQLQLDENKKKEELKNTTDKDEKGRLKEKLSEIKKQKENFGNYKLFILHNEMNQTFKDFIQHLKHIDTQHYITK